MGRKKDFLEISPWTFLKEDFAIRLPKHYQTIHLGEEEAFHKATTKESQRAERPILTVKNSRNDKIYHVIAINQEPNDYNVGERIKQLVTDYAKKGEHTVILPIDGPHNKIIPIEQSIRYNRGDFEFNKQFSNASRGEVYEINGTEFVNRIPITEQESIIQRVGSDLGIEHYIATKFIDADGDERGNVLALKRITMSSSDYQQYPSRKLVGPGILELLVDNTDFSKPGIIVPSNKEKWGDYLNKSILPVYHRNAKQKFI